MTIDNMRGIRTRYGELPTTAFAWRPARSLAGFSLLHTYPPEVGDDGPGLRFGRGR